MTTGAGAAQIRKFGSAFSFGSDLANKGLQRRFAWFAIAVLLYNLPVILWGAYVRVSFSGDGCGANWPFCNGQVIPQQMTVPTAIEYAHRMMTGLDTALVALLCLGAFALFPTKHVVRRAGVWSMIFLLLEALLGAGLVLFRFVAKDRSVGRIWYLSAHLTNTMLLLGALTATAWFAYRGVGSIRSGRMRGVSVAALLLTVAIAVTGAIAALGDTLYPVTSLAAGFHQDVSSNSATLLRLRFIHPVLAIGAAMFLLLRLSLPAFRSTHDGVRRTAILVAAITVFQLLTGVLNLGLLAPLPLQLFHLLLADLLWIAVVLFVLEEKHQHQREFIR